MTDRAGRDGDAKLLEVSGLSVHYGAVVAVDSLSFSIAPGSVMGLIGPNGAGKTTVIDALTGFVRPVAGSVSFGGEDVTGGRAHKLAPSGLVRTFQSVELFDDLTVEENLLAASERPGLFSGLADLFRPSSRLDRADVEWALEVCDLGAEAQRYPRELPLGRRKLVGVARALASRPRLVLLDEPAAGLDTRETTALGERLTTLSDHDVTLLLVDHDMGLVLSVCDEILVLDFGHLIAQGSPGEIRNDDAVIEAYLGSREPGRQEEAANG